jgi:DNA-binding CsgD family transcriptional regulator
VTGDSAPRPDSAAAPSAGDDPDGYTYGRERESSDTDYWLTAPDGPYMVTVLGERGAGRTTFVRDAASRQRAAGTAVLSVDCVPGDGDHPYLLALRLVKVLEQHRFDTVGQRRPGNPVGAMLAAIEHGDQVVAAETVTAALMQPTPTLVVLDDAHYADFESIWLLGTLDFGRTAPHVRLLASLVQRVNPAGEPWGRGSLSTERVGRRPGARRIELPPMDRQGVAAMLARRLRTTPDDMLVGLAHRLSRGVPAVVDTLLAQWARKDAIRVIGGYALLAGPMTEPVLPQDDRFIEALYALGEPAVSVASALSVLWPLGREARRLAAEVGGLSAEAVRSGLRDLVEAGIIDELPGPAEGDVRGWIFRIPLVERSVRERLGPLDRGNLSGAAVEVLWAADPKSGEPAAVLLEEADADSYLPDRIAEAGGLIDPERAVAELVAAAERTAPEPGCTKALWWLKAASHLVEDPGERGRLILRAAAYASAICYYPAARQVVESLLRGDLGTRNLTEEMHQEAVGLLVGAASAAGDLAALSRMAEARWWKTLGLPAGARASGRVLALCALGRWREALAVLALDERPSGDAAAVLPALYRAVAEMALGRHERFRRSLAVPELAAASAGTRYAVTVIQVDQLLGLADLRGAASLLAERRMDVEELPAYTRFLWRHLEGRWEEAMRIGRQLFASRQSGTPALGHHLFPERVTALLMARGRIRTVVRLVGTMREELGGGDGFEHLLCRAEAEAARTLGDLAEAERTLRRGLNAALVTGEVYATDELWAELAAVQIDTGDLMGARDSLRHLERIAEQTDGERTGLLWLLASARLLGTDGGQADAAHKQLMDAVALARRRGQPVETAVTLLAAARQDDDPAAMLTEAYELFGEAGALLWRFRTRAEMRRARATVPRRGQATAESEHLLAMLVSDGLTNRQAAAVLGLSQDAVANRLTRLFARTGVRSRTEIVTAVMRRGGASGDW